MGGKSSSSSSTSNQTTTETYDQRVTVGGDGLAVGSDAEVYMTDHGAIEGAADVLQAGLEGAAVALDKGLGLVDDIVQGFSGVVKDNNDILREQAESDTKEFGELVTKGMALMTVAALAIAWVFRKGKK